LKKTKPCLSIGQKKEEIIKMINILDRNDKVTVMTFLFNINESNKSIFQENSIGTAIDLDRLPTKIINDLFSFVKPKYTKLLMI